MASIFLLPNGTFFFELVIFIVVLGVIAKFILPPIQKTLEDRARIIADAARAADEANEDAAQLAAARDEVLARARADARSAIEEANLLVEEKREQARQKGGLEHDAIVSAALMGIESERVRVRAEVVGRLEEIVVQAAGRVIGAEIDATRHRAVIDEAIQAASAPLSR